MKRGFTLVEVAIALVIIGLLTAGILAGSAMIKTTRFHRLVKEIVQIETDFHRFKTMTKYYPGDYPDYNFGHVCGSNESGNGDHRIIEPEDRYIFVSLNKLLQTGYETCGADCNNHATACGTGYYYKVGVNMAKSQARKDIGFIFYTPGVPISPYVIGLVIGADGPNTGPASPRGAFLPIDNLALDKKIDDAVINTGRLSLPLSGFATYNPEDGTQGSLSCATDLNSNCLNVIQWGILDDPLPPTN